MFLPWSNHSWQNLNCSSTSGQIHPDEVWWASGRDALERRCVTLTEPSQRLGTVLSVSNAGTPSPSCSRHLPVPPNRLAEDVNTKNPIPLTTGALVSPAGTPRKAPLCARRAASGQTRLFSSAERWNLSVITGFEVGREKSGTRKLPVIWQLKAIAGGDGSGGNQGVWRPSEYACEERGCHLRVASIFGHRLLSSQRNS